MPMDPKYPQERLRVMLEDAQAPVIVTESALRSHVPPEYAESMTIIEIDSEWDALIGKGSRQNPRIVNESSRDLAYAIYTSGSTGRPKGVMLEHRSIVNYITWHIDYYDMSADDRVFANAGLAFDASMAETWPTLAVGASIYPVVDREVSVTPSKLLSWMVDEHITFGFLTTQLCEAVIEEDYPKGLKLRVLYTGG